MKKLNRKLGRFCDKVTLIVGGSGEEKFTHQQKYWDNL